MQAVEAGQFLRRSLSDDRIEVDRIQSLYVGVFFHDPADRPEHVMHGLPEVLAPVRCDKDKAASSCPIQFRVRVVFLNGSLEGIDRGVAGHEDRLLFLAFFDQVLSRHLRGSKVVSADDAHRLPVELFRIGAVDIIGAQPRLHMSHRDLEVEARERRHESRAGIPVDQDHIRSHFFEYRLDPVQDIRRDIEQRLFVLHDGQVVIGNDLECFKDLIQHLTVLAGHANDRLYFFPALKFVDQRAHLDRFRPCAEYQHYLLHSFSLKLFQKAGRPVHPGCTGQPVCNRFLSVPGRQI